MFKLLLVAFAAGSLASTAGATQFIIVSDVAYGVDGLTYVGPLDSRQQGTVNDGGRDAFDQYGSYRGAIDADFGGLTITRQVEGFTALNLYRFFDTFTNNTTGTISTTLTFIGNLGSDAATHILSTGPNSIVSCQWDGTACFGDPVIASVSGNYGMATMGLVGDAYSASFDVTVAPGASISLLNFAFVASDFGGTTASDADLATSTAQSLIDHPYLDGLTDDQIASIVNFHLGAVPEPASWATMLLGFGVVGGVLRRRAQPGLAQG